MRKFYLELDGVRIKLNNESGILFTNPSGLGSTMGNSFAEISDGFFRLIEKKQKQGSIAGDLTIFSSAYLGYETFVNQLFTAEKIVFVYDPAGTEYFIDVAVNYITKTESVIGIDITVPISFIPLSMWYTEQTLTGTGSINVTAGGHIGSAVELEITGTALSNPVISLGNFATIAITETLASADELKYSNFYDDSYVEALKGGVVVDEIVNVNTSNPIYEHSNGAYTVTVTDENSASPTFTAKVRKYWRTV